MTVYSMRKGFLKPLSFGVRRENGGWPPSNLGGIFPFPRVPCPFVPVPAVLPRRPAMPRATRCFFGFEPGAGFRSWTFIDLLLLDGDEVRHACQHPPDLRSVG